MPTKLRKIFKFLIGENLKLQVIFVPEPGPGTITQYSRCNEQYPLPLLTNGLLNQCAADKCLTQTYTVSNDDPVILIKDAFCTK